MIPISILGREVLEQNTSVHRHGQTPAVTDRRAMRPHRNWWDRLRFSQWLPFPQDPLLKANGKGGERSLALADGDADRADVASEVASDAGRQLGDFGAFASGVSHDMCNLLWAIAGQIDLARRQMPQDHPALRHLDTMERALAQGNELVESLSTTARKHEPCPMKPVELRGLIGKLLDLIRGLMGPEIEVVDLASAGAPIWVEGDPVEIRRALINLATNSRVAMPAGGRWEIALRVFQRRSGLLSSTGLVEITVEDTGCGMDEAVRSRLFDRYFTTRTGRGGKGLGAFLVADIAARHNGCVEVESEPEAGTRITLTLPQLTVESHAVDCGDHRLAAQAASAGVLVVGSDERSRSKLGFALGQSGYQVLEAADEVAVEAFVNQSAGPVRTAVLAMNGHRDRDLVLYRRLRTIASLQSVFVVASKRDQQPADLDPADRWFATPLRVDELISAVGRCLESPAQQGR